MQAGASVVHSVPMLCPAVLRLAGKDADDGVSSSMIEKEKHKLEVLRRRQERDMQQASTTLAGLCWAVLSCAMRDFDVACTAHCTAACLSPCDAWIFNMSLRPWRPHAFTFEIFLTSRLQSF
jgi:hypothetical protein